MKSMPTRALVLVGNDETLFTVCTTETVDVASSHGSGTIARWQQEFHQSVVFRGQVYDYGLRSADAKRRMKR